jgi:glycosyltransferase involved in cell wall biosynthesis
MRIVINCVGWSEYIRGVDRYFSELLRSLLKIDSRNEYFVFIGSWQKYFKDMENHNNVRLISVQWSSMRLLRNIWHGFVFPFMAKRLAPDVIHLPNTMPLFFRVCPTVCTIHDLLEYTFPETFGFIQTRMRKMIVRFQTRNADRIIAVSDLAKDSIVDILRVPVSKMRVIYSGVNQEKFKYDKIAPRRIQEVFAIQKKYILFVGILEKKKNLNGLIKAYSMLPDLLKSKYQLVIAGRTDNAFQSARSLVEQLYLKNHVIFLNQVEDNLELLYQGASLFVLPSFYEGFGLPVFEAIASGLPVVVSNRVAVAKKLLGCCEIIDPFKPEDIADKILLLLKDKKLRQRYITDGMKRIARFTWDTCAKESLRIYRECAEITNRKYKNCN